MSKHADLDTFGRSGNPAFGDNFKEDAQFSDSLKKACLLMEQLIKQEFF